MSSPKIKPVTLTPTVAAAVSAQVGAVLQGIIDQANSDPTIAALRKQSSDLQAQLAPLLSQVSDLQNQIAAVELQLLSLVGPDVLSAQTAIDAIGMTFATTPDFGAQLAAATVDATPAIEPLTQIKS